MQYSASARKIVGIGRLLNYGVKGTLLKPIVGAFFLAPLRLAGCGSKPSDAELISHFQAHRQEIDTLRQKMQAEQVVTRLSNFGADSSNLPVDSVEKYRRMFHNIDPTMFDGIEQVHGFYFDPKSGFLELSAWSVGLAGSGAEKSFMYKPPNPSPLVGNLDAYRPPKGQGYGLAYRHIDGDWYLEYDAN